MTLNVADATLYDFPFSSSCYRLRIALNLKGVSPAKVKTINLREGTHLQESFVQRAGLAAVPVMDFGGASFGQSLALIEWLDAAYPTPRLIPEDATTALKVRSLALTIACDIHPLNVPRVLKCLTGSMGLSDEARQDWYVHWVREGFTVFERQSALLEQGRFCVGDSPTLADVCLVPQVLNARRSGVETSDFARIEAIYDTCMTLAAFRDAAPE